jgi:hypothetical protein
MFEDFNEIYADIANTNDIRITNRAAPRAPASREACQCGSLGEARKIAADALRQ